MTSKDERRSMGAAVPVGDGPLTPGGRAANDRRLAGYHQHLADRYRALAQLDEESGFGDLLADHEASAARYRESAARYEQLARSPGQLPGDDNDHSGVPLA